MEKSEEVPREFARLYEPYTPIQLMLAIMNDDSLPIQLRMDMAKHAAPYVHHRLAAVGSVAPPPRYALDLTKLDDNELLALERIYAKAQVVLAAEEDPDTEDSASGELIARAIQRPRER